jgi:hypothetical protein
MKQKDIATLAVIAIVAVVFSSIISSKVFNNAKNHKLTAPQVQPISSDFPQVQTDQNYKSVFNAQALDPTQLIQIGTGQNPTPFNASQ